MRQETPLNELAEVILKSMKDARFNFATIKNYEKVFSRLQKLAEKRNEVQYNTELGKAFIKDSRYAHSENYCHSRYCLHYRCIQFIESFVETGCVDWSPQRRPPMYTLKSREFSDAITIFENFMLSNTLKANTIDGYRRLVHYFLLYLEGKGYHSLAQIMNGDIVAFIVLVCKEHYKPTSLGAHLPGLRMFLKMSESTSRFEFELPEHLPKKIEILEIYSDAEHARIHEYLNNCCISLRDKAICLIALDTGMRAIDICNLKLRDIDWKHDSIHILQEKTGRALNIPLTASLGNAIADYLLSERPATDFEYIFLNSVAPFSQLKTHSGYRNILFHAVTNAGVKTNERTYGTRITRHSMASRMLRKGVPLSVISEALGHGNPNSVMVYLSTEAVKLTECTLPLPGKEAVYVEQ